jgi:hypothetical protein
MVLPPKKDKLIHNAELGEAFHGPNSVPKHILEDTIGKGCAKVLVRKVNAFKRFKSKYTAFSWIDNDTVFDNLNHARFDLEDIDPRFPSVVTHGAFRQQGVGVIPPTAPARRELGLIDPDDDKQVIEGVEIDSLFNECLDLVIDELRLGPILAEQAQGSDLRAHVVIKKTSMKGHPMCYTGQAASVDFSRDVLVPMYNSKEGPYTFAFKDDYYITLGSRDQAAKQKFKDGEWSTSYKLGARFDRKDGNEVYMAPMYDPDEHIGNRVRHVANVPMVVQLPGMTANAFVFDNLTPKMQMILKHTPDSLQTVIGNIVHATDFSSFDKTILRKSRNRFYERMYSSDNATLAKQIDRYPFAGVYTEHDATQGNEDGTIPIFYLIDRTRDDLAELFSPLASGTGDTALIGKTIGTANLLRVLSILTNTHPKKIIAAGDPNAIDCLAAQAIRNSGDDSLTIIDPIAKFAGVKPEEMAKRHVHLLENQSLFDLSLEVPAKFIGYVFHADDSVTGRCWAVTHDVTSLFANNVFREHGFDSPLRSDEVVGLSRSILAYRSTLDPVMPQESDRLVKTLLDVVECPYDEGSLHQEGTERLENPEKYLNRRVNEELVEEDDDWDLESVSDELKAEYARTKLAEFFGLAKPDELDWKIEKKRLIEESPPELLQYIAIVVDPKLTTGVSKFLNVRF